MSPQGEYIGRIGTYNVIGILSDKGGFADIWKVRHMHLGRLGAMKILRYSITDVRPDTTTYPDDKANVEAKIEKYFYMEGKLLASLRHPHIIEVYDFDIARGYDPQFGNNKPYFVMPLAEGDLESHIKGKALSPEQAVLLLEPIAQALDYAFTQAGIIHLDVKPSNILWLNKRLVLSDFGVAKLVGVMTSVFVAGTPPYCSPERFLDEIYIPHRSADIFSLGLVAYELLCGVRPHIDSANYFRLYSSPGYSLPTFKSKGVNIDPQVEEVVRKALAFKLENRYKTCMEFIEALKAKPLQRKEQIKPTQTASSYFKQAFDLYVLGRYEEALQAFNQSLALQPNDIYTFYWKSSVLRDLGRHEEALQAFNQSLALMKLHHTGWGFWLFGPRGYREEYNETLKAFNQSLMLKPDDANTLFMKGFVLCDLGRHEEALQAFNHALALEPDDVNTLIIKAKALRDLGRHEEALQAFNQSFALRPKDVDTFLMKGSVLLQLERYGEALQAFNQALALEPNNVDALRAKRRLLKKLKQAE